ncbi:MAG: hypothetical protein EOP84_26275 [Verrucomicrobiaceae bacterium]|nr:MAG: hypothetical protein EOP84_26275 [Verrucomicrobiaceae bacterium]
MAKVVEQMVVIKVSKLVKGDGAGVELITEDFVTAIDAVAGEILNDPSAVVEVFAAGDDE